MQQPDAPLEITSSCPPYWLMLSSPEVCRLASPWGTDFWGLSPRLGSLSLNPKVTIGPLPPKVKFAISVSEGNMESCSEDDEGSSSEDPAMTLPTSGPVPVPSLSEGGGPLDFRSPQLSSCSLACFGQSSLPRGVASHCATHWQLRRLHWFGSPGPCTSSTSRDPAPSSTVQTSRVEQLQTPMQVRCEPHVSLHYCPEKMQGFYSSHLAHIQSVGTVTLAILKPLCFQEDTSPVKTLVTFVWSKRPSLAETT